MVVALVSCAAVPHPISAARPTGRTTRIVITMAPSWNDHSGRPLFGPETRVGQRNACEATASEARLVGLVRRLRRRSPCGIVVTNRRLARPGEGRVLWTTTEWRRRGLAESSVP